MMTRNKLSICPACTTEAKFIKERVIDIFRCPNCQLIFADSSDDVVETPVDFFEDSAARYDVQLKFATSKVRERKKMYEKFLGRPISSVLEIGCGHAAWAEAWDSVGVKYTGIEYIDEIAKWAQIKTGKTIISGDFMDAEFDEIFDVTYFSQVLEHVGSPVQFLNKVKEVSNIVHIDVPNHDSLTSLIRKYIHKSDYGFIQPPYHLRAYTPYSLRKILAYAGLEVLLTKGMRNDDIVFGQLHRPSFVNRLTYTVADVFQRGSLLVAVAKS